MRPLPPGTVLQLMYLRDRLKRIAPGRFLEVGSGSGEIIKLLLKLGWKGTSYDFGVHVKDHLKDRFSREISEGRLIAKNEDFFTLDTSSFKVDLIISCMVMEHFNSEKESKFLQLSSKLLVESGLMIGLVPSSPDHWGLEDEIAGHFRRYTPDALHELASNNGWDIRHIAGLTWPISNILLPISNFLISRSENSKLELSDLEKTRTSGIRYVPFKTIFPKFLFLILNRYFLLPLHYVQKVFSFSSNALVLYFEAAPRQLNLEGKKNFSK